MTDAELEAMVALGEGITPGPWDFERVLNEQDLPRPWVGNLATSSYAALACGNDASQATANARAIAAVPDLIAALTTLRKQRDELREALGFYGDETAWNEPPIKTRETELGTAYENQASKVRWDRGRIARQALSNMEGE